MIKSFKCKETEKFWKNGVSKKIPFEIQKRALIKIAMLNRSKTINDLKIPISNNLEILQGDRKGTYSIRINSQYRLCFNFKEENVFNLELVDYH
ncbi:MAG: type II toxin-antitoxin system RelE/ParE family toxin [Alphaproteobacteria bacterium]